jgi:hypothetical protein
MSLSSSSHCDIILPMPKRPTGEMTIQGVRLRVYGRRTCYEVLVGDGNVDNPNADVWVYPRALGPNGSMRQAYNDSRPR